MLPNYQQLKSVQQIILDEYFEPTMGKGLRVALALVVPLVWGMATGNMEPAVWISITAEILSTLTLRGAYPLKLLIQSGAVPACAVCAALGTLLGDTWIPATVVMMGLAFLGGFVRQSGDHGPGITVGVLLLYLLTLDHPGNWQAAGDMFLWVLEGGLLALLSTLIAWAFVPFSPFRRSIALTWKTLAEWLSVFSSQFEERPTGEAVTKLDEKELSLREQLNDSMETLSRQQAIAHSRSNRYSYQLVELRRLVSEAGNGLSSLRTITDVVGEDHRFPGKLFYFVLENMRQVAYRTAISIVAHRPADVYTVRISLEKLKHSNRFFIGKLQKEGFPELADSMQPILENMERCFSEALSLMEASIGKPGRMTFFIHNFFTGMTIPQRIPWVRFEFNSRSFTFRYSLRLALGMAIGIIIYKLFKIPHGYWIAMTVMIVLQPEFGATIKKAFNRIKGTILGAVFGSLLFLIPLPLAVNVALVSICAFLMMYYISRNYGTAAFFITVMVIALFHLLEPVTWQLGGIRVLNTLAGCGLALLGGYAFWPLWERYRFPALMREAIAGNKVYLQVILQALREGKRKTFNDFIKPRREAEITNSNAFLSLKRMEDEPEHERRNLEQYYIIVGCSIRITRILNTINQQIRILPRSVPSYAADAFDRCTSGILDQLVRQFTGQEPMVKGDIPRMDDLIREFQQALRTDGMIEQGKTAGSYQMIFELLEKLSREVVSMYYAAQQVLESRMKEAA